MVAWRPLVLMGERVGWTSGLLSRLSAMRPPNSVPLPQRRNLASYWSSKREGRPAGLGKTGPGPGPGPLLEQALVCRDIDDVAGRKGHVTLENGGLEDYIT